MEFQLNCVFNFRIQPGVASGCGAAWQSYASNQILQSSIESFNLFKVVFDSRLSHGTRLKFNSGVSFRAGGFLKPFKFHCHEIRLRALTVLYITPHPPFTLLSCGWSESSKSGGGLKMEVNYFYLKILLYCSSHGRSSPNNVTACWGKKNVPVLHLRCSSNSSHHIC